MHPWTYSAHSTAWQLFQKRHLIWTHQQKVGKNCTPNLYLPWPVCTTSADFIWAPLITFDQDNKVVFTQWFTLHFTLVIIMVQLLVMQSTPTVPGKLRRLCWLISSSSTAAFSWYFYVWWHPLPCPQCLVQICAAPGELYRTLHWHSRSSWNSLAISIKSWAYSDPWNYFAAINGLAYFAMSFIELFSQQLR